MPYRSSYVVPRDLGGTGAALGHHKTQSMAGISLTWLKFKSVLGAWTDAARCTQRTEKSSWLKIACGKKKRNNKKKQL